MHIKNDLQFLFDVASIFDFTHQDGISDSSLIPGREYNIKLTTPVDYATSDKVYNFFKKLT